VLAIATVNNWSQLRELFMVIDLQRDIRLFALGSIARHFH
jgi:hypothetical protein